jgi:hypothetical protein
VNELERKMMKKNHVAGFALIILGVAITLFFGMGALRAFRHMDGRGPFNEKPPAANQADVTLIRDWMTVPYVAKMYDVPQNAIFKNLEIPEDSKNKKLSLEQLNDKYYPDQEGRVLAQTQALMQAFQKQEPPPPFPSTPLPAPTVPAP